MSSSIRSLTKRELSHLVLFILISIAFSFFSISIHIFQKMFDLFYPYMKISIVEFIFSITFFWLTNFIWITYRCWKKADSTLRELWLLSPRDRFTKLYDRRGFIAIAEHYMKIAKQGKNEMIFIYLDINGLESINNTFGTYGGDQILLDTANLLKETFRESDIIARIGGDRFAVLLYGISKDMVNEPLKRLQRKIEDFNSQKTRTYKLDFHWEVIFYNYKCDFSVEELLQQMENALNEKKSRKSEKLSSLLYKSSETLLVASN